MKTKAIVTAIALTAMTASASAFARNDHRGHYDYAKVVDVVPIVETIRVATPRRECEDRLETRYDHRPRSATPVLLGGIIGGAIGNNFGHGRGRDIATVAGALLGASVARDASRNHAVAQPYTTTRTVCETVTDYHEERHTLGYEVTYRYRGREYVTETDHHPGKRIRVRVDVHPAE